MADFMSYYLFLDDIRNPKDAYCYDEKKTLEELSGISNGSWKIVRGFNEFKNTIEQFGLPLAVSFDCDLCEDHVKHYMRNGSAGIYEWEHFDIKCGVHCAKYLKSAIGEKNIIAFIHSANHVGREIIRKMMTAPLPTVSNPKQ